MGVPSLHWTPGSPGLLWVYSRNPTWSLRCRAFRDIASEVGRCPTWHGSDTHQGAGGVWILKRSTYIRRSWRTTWHFFKIALDLPERFLFCACQIGFKILRALSTDLVICSSGAPIGGIQRLGARERQRRRKAVCGFWLCSAGHGLAICWYRVVEGT